MIQNKFALTCDQSLSADIAACWCCRVHLGLALLIFYFKITLFRLVSLPQPHLNLSPCFLQGELVEKNRRGLSSLGSSLQHVQTEATERIFFKKYLLSREKLIPVAAFFPRKICGHQFTELNLSKNTEVKISINLVKKFLRISIAVTWILARGFACLPSFFSQILDFFYWTVLIFINFDLIWTEWHWKPEYNPNSGDKTDKNCIPAPFSCSFISGYS